MHIPTIRVRHTQFDADDAYRIINAVDFDAAVHVLLGDEIASMVPAPVEPVALRHDGQTFEQHVAAGYLPEHYPLPGFAAVPSEGLTKYRSSATQPEPVLHRVNAARALEIVHAATTVAALEQLRLDEQQHPQFKPAGRATVIRAITQRTDLVDAGVRTRAGA